jgi:hypothetical protein
MVVDRGMSYEQALLELGDIDSFCRQVCACCTSNDWYCPTDCTDLEKARRIDFDRIVFSYARNDGDLSKVMRYIKQAKEQ